jgi:hypothetical protein
VAQAESISASAAAMHGAAPVMRDKDKLLAKRERIDRGPCGSTP